MKRVCLAVCLLFALLAGGYWYLHAGLANSALHVDYSVSITDPASGRAKVRMTLDTGRRLFLDLYMRDSNLNGIMRVDNLKVSRGTQVLPSWPTVPGFHDLIRIWTAGSGMLTIEYDVNPLWLKGDSPRSFLGADFGYLRGMALLYTPIAREDLPSPFGKQGAADRHSGTATLKLSLPDGWQANSPWTAGTVIHTNTLRNVYLGLGKLTLQPIEAGESKMQLAVYTGLPEAVQVELMQALPDVFSLTREIMQVEPLSGAPRWSVSVLPDEPIHGGAAGTNSLVCSPDLGTLVHEMFHWWNGHTLQFTKDANWIHEGFTTYYQGKLLRLSNHWTDEQLVGYLDRKYAQIPNPLSPINLSQASTSFVSSYSRNGYYQVYSGGALVAACLDRELENRGRSLDEVWPELYKQPGLISTDTFLTVLTNLYGGDVADQCRSLVLGQQPIPRP